MRNVTRFIMVARRSLILIFLALPFLSRGDMACTWRISKQGVTISFLSPCNQKYRTFVDSFLTQLVDKLNRNDTSLPILVMANDARLSYPNFRSARFVSIGFDTLRLIDDDFIMDHYSGAQNESMRKNYGANQFRSHSNPLDINSSDTDTTRLTGIKVILRADYYFTLQDWQDLEKLILFSAKNVNFIKQQQTRDTVQYDYNGWYLSLVSIDTLVIKAILNKGRIEKKTEAKEKGFDFIYPLVGLLLACSTILLFTWRRRYER